MNDEMVYKMLLQRMDEIQLSIKDIRDAQAMSSRDSRDTAVQMERMLGQIEQFSRTAEVQREMESNMVNMDLRLEIVETKQRAHTECEEKKHEIRIEKMERGYSRFMTATVATIVVVNIMLFIAKEVL
jgi:hypothetical protein